VAQVEEEGASLQKAVTHGEMEFEALTASSADFEFSQCDNQKSFIETEMVGGALLGAGGVGA